MSWEACVVDFSNACEEIDVTSKISFQRNKFHAMYFVIWKMHIPYLFIQFLQFAICLSHFFPLSLFFLTFLASSL